jgi:hypothetical protein
VEEQLIVASGFYYFGVQKGCVSFNGVLKVSVRRGRCIF